MQNLVLKIGGSVIPDKEAINKLAKKIAPLSADYEKIAVVISALKGETDRLWQKAATVHPNNKWGQLQYVAEQGEFTSAKLMQEALKAAGASVDGVSPQETGLKASGKDPESCTLSKTNKGKFKERVAENEHDFIVIPGYVAVHEERENKEQPMLAALGRNSTDLIAVEVAKQLGTPLYFVKSAPSVYTVDPELVENPKPIRHMTHEQALRYLEYGGHPFIMRRAVEHARDKRVELIFGSLNGEGETKITVNSDDENAGQFAALPVVKEANLIRFTTSYNNKHKANMFQAITDEGIHFLDKNEVIDPFVLRSIHELYVDDRQKDALIDVVKRFASDGRVEPVEIALITLIDTSLDVESHHTNMVTEAFAETDILNSPRTSGVIMHIPVKREDMYETVNLLAQKFALTQDAG